MDKGGGGLHAKAALAAAAICGGLLRSSVGEKAEAGGGGKGREGEVGFQGFEVVGEVQKLRHRHLFSVEVLERGEWRFERYFKRGFYRWHEAT